MNKLLCGSTVLGCLLLGACGYRSPITTTSGQTIVGEHDILSAGTYEVSQIDSLDFVTVTVIGNGGQSQGYVFSGQQEHTIELQDGDRVAIIGFDAGDENELHDVNDPYFLEWK